MAQHVSNYSKVFIEFESKYVSVFDAGTLDDTYRTLTENMSMRPSFFRMLMLSLQKM